MKKTHTQNDLAEQMFKTPKGMQFVKYGKRRDADYKMSVKPSTTEYLIEVVWRGEYQSATFPTLKQAHRHLTGLCSKFKARTPKPPRERKKTKKELLEEAKQDQARESESKLKE